MLHFEYAYKSAHAQQQARTKYEWLFHSWLNIESIEARYLLLEFLHKKYNYLWWLDKDSTGKPVPIMIEGNLLYWSLSHTKNFVWFSVSSLPTGIDIVEREERNEALFEIHTHREYELLGEKNWHNFYLLWSAKEAIIKAQWWDIEAMKGISLIEKQDRNIHIFDFEWQRCTIQVRYFKDSIISIFLSSEYEHAI